MKIMLGLNTENKSFKKIDSVISLNKYLNSHIEINIDDDVEFIKACKLIKIVNSILDEYDTSILHNRKLFERAKAFMIKDLVKNKSFKLTKDLIKRHISNKLTGSMAYSLRKKSNNG